MVGIERRDDRVDVGLGSPAIELMPMATCTMSKPDAMAQSSCSDQFAIVAPEYEMLAPPR